jgi:hypothetical protein
MCTVLKPPGVNPTAVNKYIYHIKRRKTGRILNNKTELTWSDLIWGSSAVHEEVTKTRTNCSQNTRCMGRDLKSGTPKNNHFIAPSAEDSNIEPTPRYIGPDTNVITCLVSCKSHAHCVCNGWRYTQQAMQPPLPLSYTCKLLHSEASPISWATLCLEVTWGIQSWKGIHWRASGGNDEKMQFLFTDVFHSSQDTHLTLWHTVLTLPYSRAGRLATLCPDNCTNYKSKYGTVALLATFLHWR